MIQRQAISNPIKCLFSAPADPLTGRLRAGPLRRYSHPPDGVRYDLRTDRFVYPAAAGHYQLSAVNVGVAAVRFLIEHAVPLRQHGYDLVHSFFWDLRRYEIPWIHESDQAFGQFMNGYLSLRSSIRTKAVELFSAYLNTWKCKAVITWSEWAKRGYVQDGVDPSKIFVIPPSFGQVFDTKPHEGMNILFIGRDYVRKGGKVAVEVFEAMKEFPNARLLYVGRVDERKIVARMKENRRIRYIPSVSSSVLEGEIFPVSDLFFLPTRADAFAISVIEAMSRGIPVVASSVCALPEIVENGISGLLSPPDEPGGFVRNITALLGDVRRMRRMGEEARKRVELLFGIERTNRSLRDVYMHALKLGTGLAAP
jgi:glycosyltransferase involved in cell wall biosynthesis